jgi:MFS family permease
MAWSSMASPAIFAVIGDALPKERRAMGFTVQSILKRVPVMIAPIIGGLMITSLGIISGVRTGLAITLGLAAVTVIIVLAVNIPVKVGAGQRAWCLAFVSLALKRLLISDVIIRTCEGMAEVFIILYVINIIGVSTAEWLLVAIEMATR